MSTELHILLVEDSRADAKIIARAFSEARVAHRLTVYHDGKDALDYLFQLDDPAATEVDEPDLILLDLNLPGLDGCQVLSRIKAHPRLKCIPVVVLTTSRREEDVIQTYEAGVNSYIQKPAEFPAYREIVSTLHAYWQDVCVRPPSPRPRA